VEVVLDRGMMDRERAADPGNFETLDLAFAPSAPWAPDCCAQALFLVNRQSNFGFCFAGRTRLARH
jgi:hypothetical protein